VSVSVKRRVSTLEAAVHVRGGDFLTVPKVHVDTASYYVKAVRLALNRGFGQFAIITDDPPYATRVFDQVAGAVPEASFRVLGCGADALEDFDTLRYATALIIGNSTFAWWAAVLGGVGRPIWSPTQNQFNKPRDFFLPNEIPVNSAMS
jgi:hypothetical protein